GACIKERKDSAGLQRHIRRRQPRTKLIAKGLHHPLKRLGRVHRGSRIEQLGQELQQQRTVHCVKNLGVTRRHRGSCCWRSAQEARVATQTVPDLDTSTLPYPPSETDVYTANRPLASYRWQTDSSPGTTPDAGTLPKRWCCATQQRKSGLSPRKEERGKRRTRGTLSTARGLVAGGSAGVHPRIAPLPRSRAAAGSGRPVTRG